MVGWCILVHSGPLRSKTISKHKTLRILTVGTMLVGASSAPLRFCSCCCLSHTSLLVCLFVCMCCCCCLSHTSLLFVCLFVCVVVVYLTHHSYLLYVCMYVRSFLGFQIPGKLKPELRSNHKPLEKWQKEFLSSCYLDFLII